MRIIVILLILISIINVNFIIAQNGLDMAFNASGKVLTDLGDEENSKAISLQSDGKIIVAGYNYSKIFVARYTVDGQLDSTFGINGVFYFGNNIHTAKAYDCIVQYDDKIVIVGSFWDDPDNNVLILRLTSNGSLDSTFSSDGYHYFLLGDYSDAGLAVTIDNNNNIIVAGKSYPRSGGEPSVFLTKFTSAGEIDSSFAQNGTFIQKIGNNNVGFQDIKYLENEDKILVGGYYQPVSSNQFLLMRFNNSNGKIDSSFGNNGIATSDIADLSQEVCNTIDVQNDGKIVCFGTDFSGMRFNFDGSLDTTFGNNGIVINILSSGQINATRIEENGNIIVAGYSSNGNNNDFAVVRLENDGSFKSSLKIDFNNDDDIAYDMCIQNDNKILLTGVAKKNGQDIGIIRINSGDPLLVEFSFFIAMLNEKNKVILEWQTITEMNNYGFVVERKKLKSKNHWEEIGFVNGAGNSNSPKEYFFTDNMVESGKYSYRLKQIDIDGTYEYSNIVEVNVGSPSRFKLKQNYPNPFNPTTTIKYAIPSSIASDPDLSGDRSNLSNNSQNKQIVHGTLRATNLTSSNSRNDANVRLIVYDVLGRKIATLVNQRQLPGNYSVQFNASNLPSGVYFYTLRVGDFTVTKKMLLLK